MVIVIGTTMMSYHNDYDVHVNTVAQVRVVESISVDYILVEYYWKDDAPSWPSTMFKAGVPLNLTAILKSGTATTYNLFVDEKELTDSSPSIFYTFQSVSCCDSSLPLWELNVQIF